MRAFFVLGPEASGTRWLTSLFIKAGCAGTAEHAQPFDDKLPEHGGDIVLRRSVPYWGRWPDLGGTIKRLQDRGYDVTGVVIIRDWQITRQSQVVAGHVRDEKQAQERMQEAAAAIFFVLWDTRTPYTVVTYESLLLHDEATVDLFDYVGLPVPDADPVDGNEKYYRGMHV